MRVEELDVRELLELEPDGGVVRFAGQRALILDALAMGLLRRQLVDGFGILAAATLLGRLGFAHGWRMAEAMGSEFKWDSDEEWRRAGARIHTLQGLVRLDAAASGPLSKEGATMLDSYEAEQHLLQLGRSDGPVCWFICGLSSGYLSRIAGQTIYVLEDRCIGKGDATCHIFGRTREGWGEERSKELPSFDSQCIGHALSDSLSQVIETLKDVEKKLRTSKRALVQMSGGSAAPLGIIAHSSAMREVVDLAMRVAKVDSTVLISGESGAGKERIARLLHEESPRAAGAFIAVNCGAISETLLESELFGHARGAFTGATQDRAGLFEAANGGTLLLDEVGEISPAMQVKLLRALQEREIRRVGETRSRPIDVRVVAATNRDLGQEVAAGRFRGDLYYRLKVVELRVPPLRERSEDILPLARVLLADAATRMQRRIGRLSPQAADQLLRYGWPGNVRELENAMERAVALARGQRVELEDLPEEVRQALPMPTAAGEVRPLEAIEKEYILAVLERNGGNQTQTAKQLGIGAATLYRKLKDYRHVHASSVESARLQRS